MFGLGGRSPLMGSIGDVTFSRGINFEHRGATKLISNETFNFDYFLACSVICIALVECTHIVTELLSSRLARHLKQVSRSPRHVAYRPLPVSPTAMDQ
jgi:hypothetical protein